MSAELRLYTDGASGGEPSQGAVGYVLLDGCGEVLLEHAQQIGDATGSEAEYRALLLGLGACQQYVRDRIECLSDSETMVRQLRAEFHVDNPRLQQMVERVHRIAQRFRQIRYSHVRVTDPEMARTSRLAGAALRAPA